jgi:hypothetical protein
MFHEGGAELPPGVKARRPEDVAAAVVRAIRQTKAEIDVADLLTKVGATVGLIAPQTAGKLGRVFGADKVARQLAEGHKEKR